MEYETVRVSYEKGVAVVTLDRPDKLNPLGIKTVHELLDVCSEVEKNDTVRSLVLTGAGRAFCVGLDMGEMYEGGEFTIGLHEKLVSLYNSLVYRLKVLELPTIAAINGHALGGGFALALSCDILIACDSAKMGPIFVQRGASAADMGTSYILPRAVKAGHAVEMMLTGDYVDPARGERIGLFNRVLPAGDVLPAAMKLAEKIAAGPPLGLKFTKRALNRSVWAGLWGHIGYEAGVQSLCTLTSDFQEAWKALAEKRPPDFQGR